MRRILVLAVLALCVLAPLVGAAGATGPANQTNATQPSANASSAPPDPQTDRIGWEDGYWYNESIDVDQSDGLSQSELDAVIGRTMARVEHLRGLEFEKSVPVTVVSRSEFRNQTTGGSDTSETLRTFDNAKFEALFLVNESTDSIGVQNENSGSNTLGYYSPSKDEIVLIYNGDSPSSARVDELTLAHELMHALQDQQFNLSDRGRTTRDAVNGRKGLVEGDPRNLEHIYRPKCGDGGAWNGTCVEPEDSGSTGGGGSLANIGVYFVKYFPYADGPGFVSYYHNHGGWDAVNQMYADPPASAEQVIHPEKYRTDPPTNVSLADQTTDSWERVRPSGRVDYAELGQSSLAAMFAYPLYDKNNPGQLINPREWLNYTSSGSISSADPLNYDLSVVDGWDGDKMYVYQNADGETGYVWRFVWDSEGDATEFANGYRSLLDHWNAKDEGSGTYVVPSGGFADAFHLSVDGKTVTIVNAPTKDQLTQVRTSLDLDTGTQTTSGTTSNDTTTDTTSGSSPGFGLGAALAAVLAAVLLARRR